MTSDGQDVFVWMHLPGQSSPVVAGRLSRVRTAAGVTGEFVYGKSYLARSNAVEIDPVALPLQPQAFATTHLDGWLSALLDAGPDDWGKRLIERLHGPQDTAGYLLHARGHHVGALAFSPAPNKPPAQVIRPLGLDTGQLGQLLELHRLIEQGDEISPELEDLLLQGTSAGGARPKTTVEHAGALWLAKFPSTKDRPEEPPVPLMESSLLTLAQQCGIRVPRHQVVRVGETPVLLVERFDRQRLADGGYARWRYVSARTLLWSKPEIQKYSFMGSYTNLARRMREWERTPEDNVRELYRRIAFNCLVGNTDDHDRNTGFIAAEDGFFRLAPAFDLTSRPRTPRMYLAMAFGSNGAEVTLDNLLSETEHFGYSRPEAEGMIRDQWSTISAGLEEELTALGCPEHLAVRALSNMPGQAMLGAFQALCNEDEFPSL